MSVGPIVYTIVAEIGSTRLRTQTVVLGRSAYYVANIIGGVLQPYFMSPTAWNAQGKTVSLTFVFQPVRCLLLIETPTGLLLGQPVFAHHSLGLLPPARDEGPHIRGDGYHVPAQGAFSKVRRLQYQFGRQIPCSLVGRQVERSRFPGYI